MIRVYAYSNCDTCRRALRFLSDRGIEPEILPVRETPPSKKELRRALELLGGEIRRLFNTSGQDYRTMALGTKLAGMSTDEAIALLAAHGNLVKRPFLISDQGVLVGFREEEWTERFPRANA